MLRSHFGLQRNPFDPETITLLPHQQDIFDILHDGVQQGDTKLIAQQLREMKAIWEHRGLNGLVRRREAEAHLVEKAV